MNNMILSSIKAPINKAGFLLKQHSPEIMIVTGIVGIIFSTVKACQATTKLAPILDDAKDDIEKIHECHGDKETPRVEGYSDEDFKKDLMSTYVRTGLKVAKLYAPAAAIGAASIGCILGSHNIMKGRNAVLASTLASLGKDFKDYRARVIDKYGDDAEKELRYNIKEEEVEELVTDDKGKEKKVKKKVKVIDDSVVQQSPYAKFFDECSREWKKDSDYNLIFLNAQQNYANQKLVADGFLFLNDVYEMLDIPKTKAGQKVGWIYDKKNPIGDNYVDFGIYSSDVAKRRFVNGYERSILLDFNVDGDILDKVSLGTI